MAEQTQKVDDSCCWCFSLRVSCIVIGLLEFVDILLNSLFIETIYSQIKIVVDAVLGILIICGAIRKSRIALRTWIVGNILRVVLFPIAYGLVGYYFLFWAERKRSSTDAIGVAIFLIYSVIILAISLVFGLFTIVVRRYVNYLRQAEDEDNDCAA